VQVDFHDQLSDASDIDCQDQTRQSAHKDQEHRVVVASNASSKPDTMMVELSHTIVAQVAMSRFGRSEDQARLAELQSVDR